MRYTDRSTPPPSQQGMWQAYVKVRGYWVPIGDPASRLMAEVLVGELIVAGKEHAHMVPL